MTPPHILVDADACPVKEEIYRVAARHGVHVEIVANAFMRAPEGPLVSRTLVADGPDVADDHIAQKAGPRSLVITSDIPLAERCLKAGALVLSPRGQAFSMDSIGGQIASRAIAESLRATGLPTSGPPPFTARDRSHFLNALEVALVRLKRQG